MTKPMTAILVMQLVQEGRVRLDGHVSDYVPFLTGESARTISVDQLLSHRSGLQQDIGFSDDGETTPLIAMINADLLSNDELVRHIMERPLRFAPGSGHGYSSDGYAVLGAIVEHVDGKPFGDVLRERILDRVGMPNTGVALLAPIVPRRAQGYAEDFNGLRNAPHIGVTPAGYLYSTIDDLYAWERALTGDRLVDAESKRLLFAPREVITAYGWKTAYEDWGGGRQFVLRTTGGLPGFMNLMVRVPERDRTIILLSNIRQPRFTPEDLARGINQALDGLPHERPRRSAAMSIARSGVDAPEALRERLRRLAADPAYQSEESELNSLGYFFLGQRRNLPAAVAVFEEIVRLHSDSWNAYDSLGEAYAAAGDRTRAIASYERSLALNPQNTNARTALDRLRAPG
jgi:CubicO group peptidase (beta-lactamase class C family)